MPQNDVAPLRQGGDIIEQVITKGDLARLTPQERVKYYNHVCDSLGLNPFTRPLEFLTLSGKMVLYARRDAADQLRKINGISVEVVSQKVDGDMLTVHVRASDKTGRKDEDFGVVSIAGLRGEARANATLKCITKAKRRVTLSIAGLGFLDETEVDDIPIRGPAASASNTAGDLDEFAAAAEPYTARDILAEAREAAAGGTVLFREFWAGLSPPERDGIRQHLDEFKTDAEVADKAAADNPDDPFGLQPSLDHLMPTEPPPPVDTPRAELEIVPPMKAGKRDWRTWAVALFTPKVRRCTASNELADLLGANEQNLEEARATLAPADRAEMERIIAEQWQKLPVFTA